MSNTWLNFLLIAIFIACIMPNIVSAHGGGLDKNGCHNDYVHGGYHCHRPQKTSIADLNGRVKPSYKPKIGLGCSCAAQKYCTGPRGGQYCINGSGRKTYRH